MTLKFKKLTIGAKITLLYTFLFSIVLIVISCFIIGNTWLYYKSVSRNEIIDATDKVETYIKSGGEITKEKLRELINNNFIEVKVSSSDFNINEGTMAKPDLYPRLDNEVNNHSGKSSFGRINFNDYDIKHISNAEYMFTHRRIFYNGQVYNIDVFRIFNHEQKMISLFLAIFIITNIIAVFVAYIIGRYISKKMLKPIIDITETADNISINDLEQRIEVPEANDEIRKLIVTFNDMIGRLDESFKKQKQFISDASHELKTPIAVIQGYINLIDRWGKSDEEILTESIESIKSETTHMNNLVQQLLFLARAENNKNDIKMEKISLNSIAYDVVKDLTVLDDNINAMVVGDSEVEVLGDAHLIRQLMWIFCENAIKYKKGDSVEININIGFKDNLPYFSVKDNGIGINKDALPHIFDRFYRADKSRNKTIEGNGLGLSIASWIIKTHNANINVVSEENVGSEFIVTFNN
ncbi:MAG: sensor histidine kinase [Lachnospirales bacterium]